MSLAALERRCAASSELWALGYALESYALLQQGLRSAASGLRATPALPPPLRQELDALLRAADALGTPLAPDEYSRAHAAWLLRARTFVHRMREAEDRASGRSRYRAFGWLILIASIVAGGYGALRGFQHLVFASASAEYAPWYAPARVTDGNSSTEWLLPNGQLGYIDLTLAAARPVHAIAITNAHNRHYMDRGIKRARVFVLDDDRVVDHAEVTFDALKAIPMPVRVGLAGKRGTRVRIQVLEHFGLGGGIAEVAIE